MTIRKQYNVSNSRFISTIGLASSVADARQFIRDVRDEMPDASHHVYAFIIGHGATVQEGMSDDGEPSGTSGPPALAVLRGAGIGDVVLVITRYFGGTKLGTGGLVQAYTGAAQEAVAALPLEEKISRKLVGITVPYSLYERLKQFTEKYEGLVEDEEFGAEVTRYIRLPEDHISALSDDLRNLSSGQVEVVLLED